VQTVPPAASTTSPTLTFDSPTAVTIEDPDNPGTLIEVSLPGQQGSGQLGAGPFATFSNLVNVQEKDGTVTRKPKVPLDLKLIEAISSKGRDSIVGKIIVGLSQAAALLLPTQEKTISALLASSGGTTINAAHLALLLPVLKVAPGNVGRGIQEFLKDAADISLLEGNREDLEEQVRVLDKGFDIPFVGTTSKGEKELFDRIRGNLEILRIEQQEEF